jgi:predicted NACHT family NTPase
MTDKMNQVSLPLINWFDEPIKQSIKAVFDGVNRAVEAKDILKKYRRAHFRSLKRSMSQLKILGMNSPVNLTDIYYPASVSTTIYRRLYERDWHRIDDSEGPIPAKKVSKRNTVVQADHYIAEHDRVVVLGGPGSGKTTLLRFLAYAYADKKTFLTTKLRSSKFPIFIRLPDLAKSKMSIEDYASDQLKKKTDSYAVAFIDRVLKNGLATILLDSLDEVSNVSKSDVIDIVRQFCETYPACSVVLSCRTADYEEIIEDFCEVELTRLRKKAVNKIVFAWFEMRNKEQRNFCDI